MENEAFLKAYRLINSSLKNKPVCRVFNSIGWHIFLEFGLSKKVTFTNGTKGFQKEWAIWIGDASWRITKDHTYIVGSGETLDVNIQSHLQNLMGKQFLSFQFTSQFLDAEFNFEEGYQLTTFFNWSHENQWTVFLPDQSSITIDCSSDGSIKKNKEISKSIPIFKNYIQMKLPSQGTRLIAINHDEEKQLTFTFSNHAPIILENCNWRLEKNGEYLVGYLDVKINQALSKLPELIGTNLNQVDIASSKMDACFQFEGGYTLKTFTCCRRRDSDTFIPQTSSRLSEDRDLPNRNWGY